MNTPTITSHNHTAAVYGRAVIAAPTAATLEAATTWHMTRFWRQLAHNVTQPRHRRLAYIGT